MSLAGRLRRQPPVVGLDLSLRHTGIAYADGSTATVVTAAERGTQRLAILRQAVRDALDVAELLPDLVVVEGYSYQSRGRALYGLGELGGVVRLLLHDVGVPWAVAAPCTLKKYATGDHQASKEDMVGAARDSLGYEALSHDEADALWLRAMGLDLKGFPPAPMPRANRRALESVQMMMSPSTREP